MRQARLEAGMTLEQLAEKVGVARQNISAYESGSKQPELQRLPAISKALKKPIGWFFEEDEQGAWSSERAKALLEAKQIALSGPEVAQILKEIDKLGKDADKIKSRLRSLLNGQLNLALTHDAWGQKIEDVHQAAEQVPPPERKRAALKGRKRK